MNENSFDFLSDSEISEMLTPFPPPDNVTKTVSPWRKATRQMLIGFALMSVVPQIFPLNLVCPVAGSVSAFLGFRSLRKETKEVLKEVYSALSEKGYNPVNQIVGYILSGDPTYITSHKNARNESDP